MFKNLHMRTAHYKSRCMYHIVICVKYRHQILKLNIRDVLSKLIEDICIRNDYVLLDYSIELEHVHICIMLKPNISVSTCIHKIKSITGYYMRLKFPLTIKQYLWGTKRLWSRGYYVSTIGDVSTSTVLKYVQSQENYNA